VGLRVDVGPDGASPSGIDEVASPVTDVQQLVSPGVQFNAYDADTRRSSGPSPPGFVRTISSGSGESQVTGRTLRADERVLQREECAPTPLLPPGTLALSCSALQPKPFFFMRPTASIPYSGSKPSLSDPLICS